MVPLVSNKYRYIFFYNPKSACSVARKLFLDLHRDELSDQQRAGLNELRNANQDEWHAVNKLFPLERDKDYESYTKFTLVRHPLTRFVSAYLNRVVMQQMDLAPIRKFLIQKYGDDVELNYSFNQFMDYFETVDTSVISDTHFQSQAKIGGVLSEYVISTRFYRSKSIVEPIPNSLIINTSLKIQLDHVCKIESLNEDFTKAYEDIFSNYPAKLDIVKQSLADLPMHNVTFTSNSADSCAGSLGAEELRSKGKMPSYTSFLTPNVVKTLANKYQNDFRLFDYSINLETSVLQFEKQKNQRVNDTVPIDFDWQHYLSENADLGANGIDNKVGAISHWIHHGRFEQRKYKRV